jgi:hypothetical protein
VCTKGRNIYFYTMEFFHESMSQIIYCGIVCHYIIVIPSALHDHNTSMLLTLVYFDLFIFWGDKIVIFLTRKTTKY